MSQHNQATSPFHDRYNDDNYSDDSYEYSANTSSRRYKTKSPLHRSDQSFQGRGRLRGQLSNSGRIHQEMKRDNIARHVLSARRLKINEVQNQNQDLLLQLKDLREENKLLKKTQHIHEKNLQKFEDRESELPLLIQRQHNEVRSLRDQIRKWREKYEKTDRYLRDAEDELDKVKLKLKKLKSLADEKDLPGRSDLNNKLNKSELAIEEKELKIKELERYMQNLEKNHKHEVGIEKARMKEINKLLLQLKAENDKLSSTVKEKDKEIHVKNIYVTRAQIKPPHHLPNSHNGTPSPHHHHRPSVSETNTITPRERSKQMEEKRRDELRRQRELKQMSSFDVHVGEHHDKLKREKEMFAIQEKEELERIEREKIERKQREEKELQEKEHDMNKQAEREAQERQLRKEREQMKREAEERHQLEQERKEYEQRARKEKQEQEERKRREWERIEQEHRAAEEMRRLDEDEFSQAEKKKKDEILQKLREIDEGGSNMKDKDKNAFNDPFFVTQEREDSVNSASSKKNYTFSKPIENLHKGKPTHKVSNTNLSLAVGGGRNLGKSDVDDLDMGCYNPKFGSKKGVNGSNSTAATKTFSLFDDDTKSTNTGITVNKTGKKSHLMEELFGSNIAPKHDIINSSEKSSKKPDHSTTRPSFPWDDEDSPKKQTLKTKKENSATLFGSGTALVSDEEPRKTSLHSYASLPRRQKQTNTAFHNQPVVNAVNNTEDEIEEVIL